MLGKLQKKFLMGGTLPGEGGIKDRPLRKKELFWNFLFVLLLFENKIYFTLRQFIEIWTYHIIVFCRFFYWVVKKIGLLVQKLGGKKIVKFVSGFFYD